MGTDLQIVRGGNRVESVTDPAFTDWLLAKVEEFNILYGFIEMDDLVRAELKDWAKAGEVGAQAILDADAEQNAAGDLAVEIMVSS